MEDKYSGNAQSRRSVAMLIVLSLLTCGIYLLYWIYKTTAYLNTIAVDPRDKRSESAELLLCLFVPSYMAFWMYKSALIMRDSNLKLGVYTDVNFPLLGVLISALGLGIITAALIQDKINKNPSPERSIPAPAADTYDRQARYEYDPVVPPTPARASDPAGQDDQCSGGNGN